MPRQFQAGEQVNRVGKYLYKHIDGAYKITYSPNTCDVYITMYYQEPNKADTFAEMRFDLNITTYSNKVRVNVIEVNDMEKTIGHSVYDPNDLIDLDAAKKKIYDKVCHQIEREYQDYDFVF